MNSEDYRRGHQAGVAEAKQHYVLFDGVKAPGRNTYIVRYDADALPWVALLDYRDHLANAHDVAVQRIDQAEAMRERAYDTQLRVMRDADERAEERRKAGGVRRYTAGLLHAVDSKVAHAKAKVGEAEREFDRWCTQAALLHNELDEVAAVIHHMIETVRKAEQP